MAPETIESGAKKVHQQRSLSNDTNKLPVVDGEREVAQRHFKRETPTEALEGTNLRCQKPE